MRKIYLFWFFASLFCQLQVIAQQRSVVAGARNGGKQAFNVGHLYGKIVESKTNKPIAAAILQLTGNKFDTVTKQLKQAILKTVIAETNGDFSLENLSVLGNFKLKVTAVGYTTLEKPVNFGIKMPQPGEQPDFQKLLAQADKDLGNLKLDVNASDLGNVTVTSSTKPLFELGIDRKIFNVDKNLASAGQTATEIMKSIPSLNVDIDGNVTMRNAAPTIFIDGRPTNMTLDQIPSDIIDKVEIITNPSAKYDASGGNAGIINIVLKKNKKNGYNGGIRAGIDSRGKINGGIDFNYRQNKVNFFGSANYNERKSISNTVTNTTYFGQPNTFVYTNADGISNGSFRFFRGGLDYFIDNRNTISAAANYAKGKFENSNTQVLDTSGSFSSKTDRITASKYTFENFGGQLSFKHNFAENGHDITADINYNSSTNGSNSEIKGNTKNQDGSIKYPQSLLSTNGGGYNHFFTAQSDYENQLTDDTKFEAGIRSAFRDFKSDNFQYLNGSSTPNPNSSSSYQFNDQVFAAYATYSFKVKSFTYQLGARVESSDYTGTLLKNGNGSDSSFKVSYPVSFFPSAFITYKLTDKQDLQLNFSRRINRPNFFQLLPVYDFSDPQNPSVGNPGLKPEFVNSFEVSYNNAYKKNANFLATAYFKFTNNLITRYSYKDINKNVQVGVVPTDSLYYTSFINANNSFTYGVELTEKFPVVKWWDLTLNFNGYYSQIDATIPGQNISNSLPSWFAKFNNSFKINKTLSLQISGESRSKTLIPQSNNSQGGGGRGMFGGGPQASAQGYILPRYFDVDVALRKDFTMKNGQSASITLSVNDIFKTKTQSHMELPLFYTQDSDRRRDQQVFRLNFNYRFGKFDVNLFKRKNTRADQSGGSDMIGGQ